MSLGELRNRAAVFAALLLLAACKGDGTDDPDTDGPLTDPTGAVFSFDRCV